MNFIFYVKGSSTEPYKIECNTESGFMSCSCQAGLKKQICKHRLGLLKGDAKGLCSESDSSLNTFLERVRGTDLFNRFIEYEKLSNELEILEQKLKTVKSQLLKSMKG